MGIEPDIVLDLLDGVPGPRNVAPLRPGDPDVAHRLHAVMLAFNLSRGHERAGLVAGRRLDHRDVRERLKTLRLVFVVVGNRPGGDEGARDVSRLRLCSHEIREFRGEESPGVVGQIGPGEGQPGLRQRARRYLHLRDLDEGGGAGAAGLDRIRRGGSPGKRFPRPSGIAHVRLDPRDQGEDAGLLAEGHVLGRSLDPRLPGVGGGVDSGGGDQGAGQAVSRLPGIARVRLRLGDAGERLGPCTGIGDLLDSRKRQPDDAPRRR